MAEKIYKEGDVVHFHGVKGKIYHIVETYRMNVLSVKTLSKRNSDGVYVGENFSLAQYRDGSLEMINEELT